MCIKLFFENFTLDHCTHISSLFHPFQLLLFLYSPSQLLCICAYVCVLYIYAYMYRLDQLGLESLCGSSCLKETDSPLALCSPSSRKWDHEEFPFFTSACQLAMSLCQSSQGNITIEISWVYFPLSSPGSTHCLAGRTTGF